MSLVGTDFAYTHMEGLGWSKGKGLGKQEQGIVDALKPKLKFDQTGVGHNMADEFEFHWWDHVFNKAAKNIKIDENEEGDIKVLMNMDKSDLSTKKMRKKMMKQIRSKLYSNFVRAGTMTGGKMEEAADKGEQVVVVDKDLSKIKELSDDQLVEACGGLTAHKGGRHGLNMKAKLDRIAEAEREFMAKYGGGGSQEKSNDTQKMKKMKKKRKLDEVVESVNVEVTPKKKKKKDKCPVNSDETPVTEVADNTCELKKKKKKHKKSTKD